MRRRAPIRRAALSLLAPVAFAAAPSSLLSVGVAADDEDVVATITDERITESSGLVQSTRDARLAYTVNDSGSGPVVYVVDLASGGVVGTATLTGVDLVDAEALAIGADSRLYVADIGDNESARTRVDLYAIDQPGRGAVSVAAARHRLRYADGPHNAESLVSDAVDGSFYIVTKGLLGGALYRLDDLHPGGVTVARLVEDAAMPALATDADVLTEDAAVVVRTYTTAYVYSVPQWEQVGSVELPDQRQGETVAVIDGGPLVYVGTEGLPSRLRAVRLPSADVAVGDGEVAGDAVAGDAVGDDGVAGDGQWRWALGAAGALALLAGAIVAVRRRS